MTFGFITADERLAKPGGIKAVIVGPPKIGKTSLLLTMPPEDVLFIDMEAGDLSVEGWKGRSIDVRKQASGMGLQTWPFLVDLAAWIGGPNPDGKPQDKYSPAHYAHVLSTFGDPVILNDVSTLFFDSITVASRICFKWCLSQPEAFSEKTGKPDTRGAYGLLGREMVGFLTQLQHARGKNVIFVGLLDKIKDDFGKSDWVLQIEGGATARALPGIVDEIISMVEMDFDGVKHRVFVTNATNEWGYPAGDRSGQLDPIEEPHLGKLMAKIKAGGQRRALSYGIPGGNPTAPQTEHSIVPATAHPEQPTTVAPAAESAQWGNPPVPQDNNGQPDDEIPF
jgi:hypothetical protein